VDIRVKLGDALRDAGEAEEAVKQFEDVVRNNPKYVPGRIHHGIALYSAGRKAEAIAAWEEVLAQSPGNKSAEMYLNLVKEPAKGEST